MVLFGKKYCNLGHKMDTSWDHCPVCITPVKGWLVYIRDGRVRNVYQIREGKNLIGSGEDCEVRILFDSIKRHHSLIMCTENGFLLQSQGASGFLAINGIEKSNTHIIDGDIITLGNFDFKFKAI